MNTINSIHSSIAHLSYEPLINAPIINSVYYPTTSSVIIYFTPSNSTGITDYKYSLDDNNYYSTGYNTYSNSNYYFTINTSGIKKIYLIAVSNNILSRYSSININTNYTSKATISGNGQKLYTPNYEYYVFTNTSTSSTITFPNTTNINYIVIGAGGNGGSDHGGGGGAGQVLYNNATINSGNTITVTVGSAAAAIYNISSKGNSSILYSSSLNPNTITAIGGGCGASEAIPAYIGGSSGGGGGSYGYISGAIGIATGYAGGNGINVRGGGGGGGAGGVGYNGLSSGLAGAGGSGISTYSDWILTISSYMNTIHTDWSKYTISNGIGYIASGGAGGSTYPYTGITPSTIGGGGSGGTTGHPSVVRISPTPGIPNTGGGGGGLGGGYAGYGNYNFQGGSGLVIIRIQI